MAKKSLGQLLKNAEILQQAAKLTKNFGELNDTILQILREYPNQVQVQFAPNRPHDWDNHLAVLEVVYGGFILKIPVPELKALDKGLATKVSKKMIEKLYFPTKEATESFRQNARLMTRISRDMKALSIESQIPEALEALPEATRPHPLAVRGVQNYAGYVLTPFVFGWAIVPPWEMGTDSREELSEAMESVFDGKLTLPEGDSLISDYDRDYYRQEAEKRAQKREQDAKQVLLATNNWNGYSSCEVVSVASRRKAIQHAISTVKNIRRNDDGGKLSNSLLGAMALFDDGQRILFHIEDGYDFYGMRVHHTYIYFDPNAQLEDEFDEDSYEEYEVHTLSMTNGELFPQTRWGLG